MPVTLPVGSVGNVSTLSYGGVQFEELFKSKVSGRVEWDRARRRAKYVKYSLEVDGYVISTNSAPNDPTWSRMRSILQKPGLELRYSNRGFGNFNINVPLGLQDVCNGPHPEVLEFTPYGARLAAHVLWRCEVCIPELVRDGLNQAGFPQGLLAFNWTCKLSFGSDGYATYTVDGELEIARVAGRADNLERYRAYTEPQLPQKFKPTRREFDHDDAKQVVKFGYTFEEMAPGGIPVRCTGAGGNYQVKNTTNGPSLVQWTASLHASYNVVPTGPRREAWMRFLGLMRDRMNTVQLNTTPYITGSPTDAATSVANGATGFGTGLGTLSGPFAVPGGATTAFSGGTIPPSTPIPKAAKPLIQNFVASEGLYEDSKTSTFECSWTFTIPFRFLFGASGIWRKMGDSAGHAALITNRDVWVTDMASVVGYTSWYNYGFRPDAEVVLSAEDNVFPITAAAKAAKTGATANDNNRLTAGAGLVRSGVDPDSGASPDKIDLPGLPSPEASWLNYQIDFITDLDPGMALHKPLPQGADVVDSLGSVDLFGANPDSDRTNGLNTVSRSTGRDVLQRMATSTYRVGVRGYGVRAGYKVPVPDLKVFGGVAVSPAQQRVIGPRIVANYSGIPVYLTAWMLWYDVPLPPRRQQDAPPNLSEHIGDVASPPATISPPISIPEPPIGRSDLPGLVPADIPISGQQ